jgi:alpha-1,2-mannosyltransferase
MLCKMTGDGRRATGDRTHGSSVYTSLLVRARVGRAVAGIVVVAVTVHAIVIAVRRMTHVGDFDVSREFGRRFVAGEPLYAGGLHYPYTPTAALYFAPLALLPAWLGFALRYAVALAGLWLTLRLLHAMVSEHDASLTGRRLALAAVTLGLAAHYVVRDLDDGGPHLILLAMIVVGLWRVARGGIGRAALWFGLAAALKAPNALLLPFFVWKRQWRLAALTALAIAAWSALPVVWMGPAAWWHHQRQWITTVGASVAGTASGGEKASEERPQNQSLRATVARLFGAHLPTPVSHLPSIVIIALVAWWSRRPWSGPGDPRWLAGASAVLIVSVLLSPATWVQHLVVVIPALYLIAAAARGARRLPPAAMAAMALYAVLALGLNREVLGRAVYVALLADGLHTACLLLVLGVLMTSTPAGAPADR